MPEPCKKAVFSSFSDFEGNFWLSLKKAVFGQKKYSLKGFGVKKNLLGEAKKTPKKSDSMKKVHCPDCGGRFEIELEDLDEGDAINCPECNLELVVEVRDGKPKIRVSKEKGIDEDDEMVFDEAYEE